MNVNLWPVWVRWFLFLPAAIVAPFLYLIITSWGVPASFQDGIIWEVLSNGLWGAVFVFAGAWVAPSRRIVAFVLGAIMIAFSGFTIALVVVNPYGYSDPPFRIIVASLSAMAGAGYAAWQFASLSKEETGESVGM